LTSRRAARKVIGIHFARSILIEWLCCCAVSVSMLDQRVRTAATLLCQSQVEVIWDFEVEDHEFDLEAITSALNEKKLDLSDAVLSAATAAVNGVSSSTHSLTR
jgi:hypothetical protein